MKTIFFLVLISLLAVSCSQEEFNIGNPNAPDAARVLANPSDFQNFNISNHTNTFFSQVSFSGVYFRAMADQFSTTNAFSGFWAFCDEPRRQIVNSTSNDDLGSQAGGPWNSYNSVINNANIVLDNIENEGGKIIIDDNDLTQQELAGAYFDKGIGQGYLSMIYDKAYVVDPNTDTSSLDFNTYQEMLVAAIENLDIAIEIATDANDFNYTIYANGPSLDSASFVRLVNSYKARFSIANARTDAEAQSLNYTEILDFANKGITENFAPDSSENVLWNELHDWSEFTVDGPAGYMPTDQKVLHLLESTYPTEYPADTTILPEVTSEDPRLDLYYVYAGSNFGFLRESRGRNLFSSYYTLKFGEGEFLENVDGKSVPIFQKAEIDYIKAECHLRLGDLSSAVMALDASPRATVGNQTTTMAAPNILNALLYEVSIELDLGSGMAVEWAFMRRHDMLQAGTPTMYPVPASELEITRDEIYTFGGESAAGEAGTASGANDWRQIDLQY